MERIKRVPWLRIAIEGVVIVTSILLALGVQAWWEGRQERRTERAHLSAVAADLGDAIRVLESSNESFNRIAVSVVDLLGPERHEGVAFAELLREAFFELNLFDPTVTALSDLDASDDVDLLAPSVRRQVSETNRAIADVQRIQEDFTRTQQGILDPFVVDRLPFEWIVEATESGIPSSGSSEAEDRARQVLADPAARGMLVLKRILAGYLASERAGLEAEMRELQRVVRERQEELGEG